MAKDNKTVRQKLEQFLNEKNYFTDGLAFIESKTGVNRLYLFAGKLGGRRKISSYLVM